MRYVALFTIITVLCATSHLSAHPEDSPQATQTENPSADKEKSFHLSLQLGSGMGSVTEESQLQTQRDKRIETEGLSFAPLHVNLEADLSLNERFELGMFTRLQIIEFAALGGVQLHYNAIKTSNIKLSFRAGGGYGFISHLVPLSIPNPQTGASEEYLDTTLNGPLFYKAGVSYSSPMTQSIALKTSADFFHMIPLNTCSPPPSDSSNCHGPSYHLDMNVGITFSY